MAAGTGKRQMNQRFKNFNAILSLAEQSQGSLPTDPRIIQFTGLRRSGNHFVQYWLMSQLLGVAAHYNNVKNFNKKSISKRDTMYWYDGNPVEHPDERFRLQDLEPWSNKSTILVTVEDKTFKEAKGQFKESCGLFHTGTDQVIQTGVIRSIYNCCASRIKYVEVKPHKADNFKVGKEFIRRWLEFAKLAEDLIVYEKLLTDPVYREQLEAEFNFEQEVPEWVWSHIPWHGFGSSFVGRSTKLFDELHSRWKEVTLPKALLENRDVQKAHKKIYGWYLNSKGEKCD